ncbi:TPA: hypothetical protein ACXIO5_000945 [Neisseria meningitidis]|uniref:hypothetical protein n=1 Tax=Neisseria meningitidis TaxID=487 RepID=UPI00039A473D|nr:hypothetical protein [Neisseria meningitidis]
MKQKAIPIGKNPGGMAFLNFELLLHRHSSFPRKRESGNEKQQEFIGNGWSLKDWIPAFAGMTGFWVVVIYRKNKKTYAVIPEQAGIRLFKTAEIYPKQQQSFHRHSRVGGNLATKSNRNLSGKQKPLCRHSRESGNLGRRI